MVASWQVALLSAHQHKVLQELLATRTMDMIPVTWTQWNFAYKTIQFLWFWDYHHFGAFPYVGVCTVLREGKVGHLEDASGVASLEPNEVCARAKNKNQFLHQKIQPCYPNGVRVDLSPGAWRLTCTLELLSTLKQFTTMSTKYFIRSHIPLFWKEDEQHGLLLVMTLTWSHFGEWIPFYHCLAA